MKLENKLRKLFKLLKMLSQLNMLLTSQHSLILMEQKLMLELYAAFSWEEVLEPTSQMVTKHYGVSLTNKFKKTLKLLS